MKLSALRVANQLDLKGIKASLSTKPTADSSSDLFYALPDERYICYFNYGLVCFGGYSEEAMQEALNQLHPYLRVPDNGLRDELELIVQEGAPMEFRFNEIQVDRMNPSLVRISMLNLAQSVALDHYLRLSEGLLAEVRKFTNDIESRGRLSISRKNMLKFIGKALNTQNDIAENIYIFDAPDITWDDEYLDILHRALSKHFDLKVRFSEIEYTQRIIENNLKVFREITHQRESNLLEWIIIILILVEVVNLFVNEFFS